MPLIAVAQTDIPTTISESAAPISIDRCETLLQQGSDGNVIADSIDYTNISQKNATEVRFVLRILDADGMPQRTLTDDRVGHFAPGVPVVDPIASRKSVDALPRSAKISCAILMVRFDDGSIWNEGDGPMGTGSLFTPPPQPPATPSWHFPDEEPTP